MRETTIFDVANYFLSIESMTNKKLQKLCYYAQAWHCAFNNANPMFSENFEAWVHGPVSPLLYAKYSPYSYEKIPRFNGEVSLTNETQELLNQIWEVYGNYDANVLEVMTHKEKPWKDARSDLPPLVSSNRVISNDSMKDYYQSILE